MKKLQYVQININWDYSPAATDNGNALWQELKSKLGIVTDNVPSCEVDSAKGRRLPWENRTLKRFRREKDKHCEAFDAIPTAPNLSLGLAKQIRFEKVEISAKIKYEKKITANLKTNSKSFFTYLRCKRKLKVTVSSLKKEDGTALKQLGQRRLRQNFHPFLVQSSSFQEEPYGPLEKDCYKKCDSFTEIGNLTFSVEDVEKELTALNMEKSSRTGWDSSQAP